MSGKRSVSCEFARRGVPKLTHARVIFTLAVLLCAHPLDAVAVPEDLPVRVTSETSPAGGTVQIKLLLPAPIAVAGGRVIAAFDPLVFAPVRFLSVFSATGDAYGTAEIQGNRVDIRFQSPSGGIGRLPDLPAVTIEVPLLAGVPAGITSTPDFSASVETWKGLSSKLFVPVFSTSSITVGGVLSLARLHPGAGSLDAGTTVQLEGTGFSSSTAVTIAGVATTPAAFVNENQLRIALLAAADLQGKQVTVRNPDGATAVFYPNLESTIDRTQRTALPNVQPSFHVKC